MTHQTTAASRATQPAVAASAAMRGPAALAIHQFRYDLLAFARNGQARFFTLALPVAFLLIFATVFRDQTVPVPGGLIHTSVYYVPGIVALGIIQAAVNNLAISVTAQRENGILKRRRAAPISAGVLITFPRPDRGHRVTGHDRIAGRHRLVRLQRSHSRQPRHRAGGHRPGGGRQLRRPRIRPHHAHPRRRLRTAGHRRAHLAAVLHLRDLPGHHLAAALAAGRGQRLPGPPLPASPANRLQPVFLRNRVCPAATGRAGCSRGSATSCTGALPGAQTHCPGRAMRCSAGRSGCTCWRSCRWSRSAAAATGRCTTGSMPAEFQVARLRRAGRAAASGLGITDGSGWRRV